MGESEQKSNWFWEITFLILAVGIFLAIALPNYIGSPRSGRGWDANCCINNLRQIDAAINEWALVNGKTKGSIVTENDIRPYVKLDVHGNVPGCPSGGKYTYGKVGSTPQISCSLSTANPPHVLP